MTELTVAAGQALGQQIQDQQRPGQQNPGQQRPGQQSLPLIDHLARLARRAGEARFSAVSGWLRPRHIIALRLLRDRGPMPQHGLGEALCLDPSNVVGLLNELEERDLITRRRDPADRRRHIVQLAAGGAAELDKADAALGVIEDDLLRELSPQERADLYALLVRAAGAASPEFGSAECVAGAPSAESPPPAADC